MKFICTKCLKELPISSFKRTNRTKRGFMYRCRECTLIFDRAYRKSEKFKVRWNNYRKTNEAYKAAHRAAQIKYRLNNPDRIKAQQVIKSYRQELLKNSCERCGSTVHLHLHHPDYTKPYDVITLCIDCHEKEHHSYV